MKPAYIRKLSKELNQYLLSMIKKTNKDIRILSENSSLDKKIRFAFITAQLNNKYNINEIQKVDYGNAFLYIVPKVITCEQAL